MIKTALAWTAAIVAALLLGSLGISALVGRDLVSLWLEPWTLPYFHKGVVGGSLVAVPCAVLGCLVVLRRMAFLGDALSHAMLAGVCGGYLLMKLAFGAEAHIGGMVIGAVIASLITLALIAFVSRLTRIKEDTAIGIMYTGIFAAGVVLVSLLQRHIHIDIYHFIVGDVLGIGDSDLWVAAVVGALVLSMVVLFYRQLQLASFDRIMAAAIGLPVVLIDYMLTTGVSLVVVSGVRMVGVVMVVGLLVSPAACAYLLCNRLATMMVLAGLFGVTGVIGGMYTAEWFGTSGGGAIILFVTFQFLVVLMAAPRYGMLSRWLRLRRQLPQDLIEDVLSGILRAKGISPTLEAIRAKVAQPGGQIPRVLAFLEHESLVRRDGPGWALTDEGRVEATRMRRAHRLWESYLHKTGVPDDQLHDHAELLEHVNDPDTLAYLDQILGHPERDPHGSEIPRPVPVFEHPVPLRQLAPGHRGQVAVLAPAARGLDLSLGETVIVTAHADGSWTLHRETGGDVICDDEMADAVLINVVQRAQFA
ncbi:MAG: metal ABC transporter permease [Planctomycetota bacterium]|jgi:ABC-type Mn2+/Zn2+ transport system permease subunit/Mn-dependent DtxR family transcriptional regulator|nr:metal ABC transporter permease [Planctomycetota bacterium]